MNFNEMKLLSTISKVLRAAVITFIIISVIGYIIKPFNKYFSSILLHYSVLFLIVTPVVRVLILAWGFKKLGENKYFYYSLSVFIIVMLGIVL